MNEAKSQMAAEKYEDANLSFRKLLALKTVLPSEMCYYFAETLYKINQLQNSKNFIQKYYKLTGSDGKYYKKTVALEKLVDEKFKEIESCSLCDDKGYTLKECHECHGEGHHTQSCHYCRGKGVIVCSVCGGKGVKISENLFKEKEYHSCTVCGSKGYRTCSVCNGTKTEEIKCNVCKGTGKEVTNKICNHPEVTTSSQEPGE